LLKRLLLWGLVVAQMALLFTASSSSDPDLPGQLSDKVVHFAAYGVLGALVLNALANGTIAGLTWPRALAAILIAVLYGLSDELHQSFVPGRSPDALDVLADAAGAAAAALTLLVFRWGHEAWMSSRAPR
jgi:VanZ family protein